MNEKKEELKVGVLSIESIVIGLACLVVIQAIIKMTYPSSSELFSGLAMALLLGVLLVSMFQSWFKGRSELHEDKAPRQND